MSKEEVSKEKDEKEEDKDTKDRPGGEGKEGGGDCRREKSLGLLSQKFVQLFLVSRARVVSLEAAARTLLGSSADSAKLKTKVRRLYDIANILSSLRLIEKTHLVTRRARVPLAGRGEGSRRRRRRRRGRRLARRRRTGGRNGGAHRHERADARVQPALVHAQLARARHDPDAPALAALVRAPGIGARQGEARVGGRRLRARLARAQRRRGTWRRGVRPHQAAQVRAGPPGTNPEGSRLDVLAALAHAAGSSGSARARLGPRLAAPRPPACASWGGRRPVDGRAALGRARAARVGAAAFAPPAMSPR